MRRKYKRYLRLKDRILDTEKCELKQLAKQDCFVDEKGFAYYESEILNQSDDLNDLWLNGDLCFYQDKDVGDLIDIIDTYFNPFIDERQIPLILYCPRGNDYICLMIKNQVGEWELCLWYQQ